MIPVKNEKDSELRKKQDHAISIDGEHIWNIARMRLQHYLKNEERSNQTETNMYVIMQLKMKVTDSKS